MNPLHNELTLDERISRLEDAVDELELLLLDHAIYVDELEEEIELLKESPETIIREIHHYHMSASPVLINVPFTPQFPQSPYCGGITLC